MRAMIHDVAGEQHRYNREKRILVVKTRAEVTS